MDADGLPQRSPPCVQGEILAKGSKNDADERRRPESRGHPRCEAEDEERWDMVLAKVWPALQCVGFSDENLWP